MMAGRRAFLAVAPAAGLAAVLPRGVLAQPAFPSKPVHLIVPFAPGGSADVLSRIVAQNLSQQWGQPVIVDPRPGCGTIIGSSLVAKSPADGYAILFISNSFVINAKLRNDLPYDGIKAFVPVANMVNSPQVVAVNAASPYQTFKDWLAAAKARPKTLSIGTLGPATTQHIAAEMLQRVTGTQLIYTAFTGGAPAVNAALGGHVDTVLANLSELSAHIEAGKLRALAVTTRERLDALRQVPTVAELGYPSYEAVAWFGYAVPAGTPQAVVNKISESLRAALADPEIRQRVTTLGLQPAYLDPKAFAAHIGEQYEKYSRVIDEAKIKAE